MCRSHDGPRGRRGRADEAMGLEGLGRAGGGELYISQTTKKKTDNIALLCQRVPELSVFAVVTLPISPSPRPLFSPPSPSPFPSPPPH